MVSVSCLSFTEEASDRTRERKSGEETSWNNGLDFPLKRSYYYTVFIIQILLEVRKEHLTYYILSIQPNRFQRIIQ